MADHIGTSMFTPVPRYKKWTARHAFQFTHPPSPTSIIILAHLSAMNQIILSAIALLACFQPVVNAQRSGTTRGNVFEGCNAYLPAIGGDTAYPQSASTTYASGLACSVSHYSPGTADRSQNACSALATGSFSYFSASDSTCRCSQYFPTTNNYSSGNQGQCAAGTNEVYRLRTTFAQYTAYPCRPLSSLSLTYSTVNGNINSCFQQCKAFTYAVYVPVSAAGLRSRRHWLISARQ